MLLPAEIGILSCSIALIAFAMTLLRVIDAKEKKGSAEPSESFKIISSNKSNRIRKEDQLNPKMKIAHSYKTAQSLILAFKVLNKAGVSPEKSRAKLPAGVASVQQLTDDQAKSYLIDLRNLYIEAVKAKRMAAA